jgi:hypothetical protein
MFEAVWLGFIAATVLAFAVFFFARRRFDLLTIAFVGAVFYFSPLFWGRVLQSSPDLDPAIPPEVYLIATGYLAALAMAALMPTAPTTTVARPGHGLSEWYLILAIAGLAGSLVSSRGAIINADKVQALAQVGYLYGGFEIAASLACISAVIERSWWILAGSVLLLACDLLVGFRAFVVLTALSVALVLLMQNGRIRLVRKTLTYGTVALLLVVAMLLLHTVRFAIFDQVAAIKNEPRVVRSQDMRGDTLQFEEAAKPKPAPNGSEEPPASNLANEALIAIAQWLEVPVRLLQRSEPAIIQATLAAVVQRDMSCSQSNILKSLYLLIPPGLTKLVPNPFPPTFYDEYQPVLYPGITYGTGGNIWAEMLCRFGYVGAAIFGTFLILTLIRVSRILSNASIASAAPIALGGVIIAFYINRNDLHVTLVMLRQIAIVFGSAYVLSRITAKVWGIKTWI